MSKVIQLQPYIDRRNKRAEELRNFMKKHLEGDCQAQNILDMIRNRSENNNIIHNDDN